MSRVPTLDDILGIYIWFCARCGRHKDMLSLQVGHCTHCDHPEFTKVPDHIPRKQQEQYILEVLRKTKEGKSV